MKIQFLSLTKAKTISLNDTNDVMASQTMPCLAKPWCTVHMASTHTTITVASDSNGIGIRKIMVTRGKSTPLAVSQEETRTGGYILSLHSTAQQKIC